MECLRCVYHSAVLRTTMNPLVDSFGRRHTYLRISVTDRCNLQCVYCVRPDGMVRRDRTEILTIEELHRLARIFVRMGVRKIRLTGGEPLLRQSIEELIRQLAALPGLETVALTTNGVLLKDKALRLKECGLNAINVSLDSLRKDRFAQITGSNSFNQVMAGIRTAMEVGFAPLKMNVVVMAGINDDEIIDFVEFVRDKPINVRFIEHMPFGGNRSGCFVPRLKMIQQVNAHHRLVPLSPGRHQSGTASDFRADGIKGVVSFITPMSADFCASCSRIRLMADGSIKSCLFQPAEHNLRNLLRKGVSDDALEDVIRAALTHKPSRHPPIHDLVSLKNQHMIEIGG